MDFWYTLSHKKQGAVSPYHFSKAKPDFLLIQRSEFSSIHLNGFTTRKLRLRT